MEIEKFGSITVDEEGGLVIDSFHFAGEGGHIQALIAVKEFVSDEIDRCVNELAANPKFTQELQAIN